MKRVKMFIKAKKRKKLIKKLILMTIVGCCGSIYFYN